METNIGRVADLLDRPKAYYNIDGVGELGIGVMCLGYALLGWLQVRSPEHSFWTRMYTLFAYVAIMCAVIHYGSKAIKKHITWPRTGFVSYRRRDTVWKPAILSGVISALVSVCLVIGNRRHWDLSTPAFLVGLILAGSYAYGFAKTVRWKWSIPILMVFGSLVLALLPADRIGAPFSRSWIVRTVPARVVGAVTFTLALYGALTLVSGAITFCLYLRHTRAPGPEEP